MSGGGESFPYDIEMNHILNYQGYRLFQSSFHPDEQGTILSVNHDFWGYPHHLHRLYTALRQSAGVYVCRQIPI